MHQTSPCMKCGNDQSSVEICTSKHIDDHGTYISYFFKTICQNCLGDDNRELFIQRMIDDGETEYQKCHVSKCENKMLTFTMDLIPYYCRDHSRMCYAPGCLNLAFGDDLLCVDHIRRCYARSDRTNRQCDRASKNYRTLCSYHCKEKNTPEQIIDMTGEKKFVANPNFWG